MECQSHRFQPPKYRKLHRHPRHDSICFDGSVLVAHEVSLGQLGLLVGLGAVGGSALFCSAPTSRCPARLALIAHVSLLPRYPASTFHPYCIPTCLHSVIRPPFAIYLCAFCHYSTLLWFDQVRRLTILQPSGNPEAAGTLPRPSHNSTSIFYLLSSTTAVLARLLSSSTHAILETGDHI